MPNTLTFVVSDESVNSYGYRVLTDGINTEQFERNPIMLYMHNRNEWSGNTTGVIGRWENLRKEDGKLLADAVFDENDDFAVSVKSKVEQGFLKMASIGAGIIETSEDEKYLVKGQTRPTVTKSELVEISIVDIGSNSNALKLYDKSNTAVQLSEALPEINKQEPYKNQDNMPNLKTIALALGLKDADEEIIVAEIAKLKSDQATLKQLQQDIKAAQALEAAKLVDKAIETGLIPEVLKEGQLADFDKDFAATKSKYETLFAAQPEPNDEPEANAQLGDFITKLDGKSDAKLQKSDEKDFAWYQANDPDALLQLQAEKPEDFKKLLDNHLNK